MSARFVLALLGGLALLLGVEVALELGLAPPGVRTLGSSAPAAQRPAGPAPRAQRADRVVAGPRAQVAGAAPARPPAEVRERAARDASGARLAVHFPARFGEPDVSAFVRQSRSELVLVAFGADGRTVDRFVVPGAHGWPAAVRSGDRWDAFVGARAPARYAWVRLDPSRPWFAPLARRFGGGFRPVLVLGAGLSSEIARAQRAADRGSPVATDVHVRIEPGGTAAWSVRAVPVTVSEGRDR